MIKSSLLFFTFILVLNCISTTSAIPLRDNHLHFNPNQYSKPENRYEDIDNRNVVFTLGNSKFSTFNSVTCDACKAALSLALWKFRTPNGTYPGIPGFIMNMCKRLHIETSDVCTGMINAMRNETLYLLNRLELSGEELCGLIFPSKCPSKDLSWNDRKWTIPLPNQVPHLTKPNSKKVPPSTGKILHISDLHIDFQYTPGSFVDCQEPLCCRSYVKPSDSKSKKAGYWGSYGSCDVPYWTAESMLKDAAEKNSYDYILWTGDLPAHNDWGQNKTTQVDALKNLTSLLLKYFPETPIYPSLGNHESYPVNSFPPTYVNGSNNISWLYDALAVVWSPWLSKTALVTVKQSGYYTDVIKKGQRIVSLNMNYCNNENFWLLINPVDPNNELKWLVSVLTQAELRGESVHIIGHIPPSVGGNCLKVWRNNYYAIVERFQHIIMAQFFGHTHNDEMEIQYTDSTLKKPFAMAYIVPSLTTFSGLNPGYRVYDFDNNDLAVLDHHTYIMNLTEANKNIDTATWELEYSARNEYNMTSLSVTDWHNLYNSWIENSPNNTFDKYYANYYKRHVPDKSCGKDCRKAKLCSIAAGNFTSGC